MLRTAIVSLGLILTLGLAAAVGSAETPAPGTSTLDVPGPVPGEKDPIGEEKATKKPGTNIAPA